MTSWITSQDLGTTQKLFEKKNNHSWYPLMDMVIQGFHAKQ
jgi:hypothetical protein